MDKTVNFSDKLNKEIEKQAVSAGKKVVQAKVQTKLGELDDKTEEHLKGLKEKLNSGIIKTGLPLISSVYFLISLQQLPVFGMTVLVYFFSSILTLLLTLVILIVALVYLVGYFLIYRFPGMMKGRLGFFFALTLSFCEAIFVAYLCSVVSTTWIMVILTILIITLLLATAMAKVLKSKFNAKVGLLGSFLFTTVLYILYILIATISWTTLIITYLLAMIYQCFLILIVVKILNSIKIQDDDDNFNIAIYATLLVYKSKIDYTFGIVFILGQAFIKCCKKKENY